MKWSEQTMKHKGKAEANEKPSRIYFAAVLTILVFALLSTSAIIIMEQQKVKTLPNDTAWFEDYFVRGFGSKALSEQQKDIIHNSVGLVSSVAEDAGVTVTLKSVCGNGYYTYYKIDVELPDGMNAGSGCHFDQTKLQINDESIGLGNTGGSFETLEDESPYDNRYSFLLMTRLDCYPNYTYPFHNGIVRTLHLENIRIEDENGEENEQIEGQWEFEILFYIEGSVVELIEDPVIVEGFDWWENAYFEGEVTSFTITECSLHSQYEQTDQSQTNVNGINPVVILKDGRTVTTRGGSGSGSNFSWTLSQPISLNEVAFVKLTDQVYLSIR